MKKITVIYDSKLLSFIPGNFTGLAFGYTIRFRDDFVYPTQMAHEIVHVLQWEKYGWKFPFVYLWFWIKAGLSYRKNKFEVEARERSNPIDPTIRNIILEQKLLPGFMMGRP